MATDYEARRGETDALVAATKAPNNERGWLGAARAHHWGEGGGLGLRFLACVFLLFMLNFFQIIGHCNRWVHPLRGRLFAGVSGTVSALYR
jgi:hypothetical protein